MKQKLTKLNVSEGVALLTINRPKALNSLNVELINELTDITNELAADNCVRVVILTGTGRSFCAGGDITQMAEMLGTIESRKYMQLFYNLLSTLYNMEKPVISAVNGLAYGGGVSIILVSDIVVAAAEAKFSLSFLNVGLVPDGACLYFLTRNLGLPVIKELLFTAKEMTATEAKDLGLVNSVVPSERLLEESRSFARRLSLCPPFATGCTKRLLNNASNLTLEQFFELEGFVQASCFQTDDHRKAVKTFLEKKRTQ